MTQSVPQFHWCSCVRFTCFYRHLQLGVFTELLPKYCLCQRLPTIVFVFAPSSKV